MTGADGKAGPALAGIPKVDAAGLGGLLDVALDPDGLIYLLTDEDDGRLLRIEPMN